MLTFTWVPTYESTMTFTPKARVIKFGEGYELRQGDGINRSPRSYSLVFKRVSSEINAIDMFLSARGAVEAFFYTHPGRVVGAFVCREWVRTNVARGVDSIAATFEEVYE
jgi:phage-related protein